MIALRSSAGSSAMVARAVPWFVIGFVVMHLTAGLILGVVFQPPAISDGAETMLIVTAQDDLSGIRNVSGSVASPTGKALQDDHFKTMQGIFEKMKRR